MSRRALLALAALAAAVSPARAAPQNTAIAAAYQVSRCGSSTCAPGDPDLSSGSVVTGALQVDVTSDANLGLQWVQLQAIGGGESAYQCVHLWTPGGAKHLAASATFDTAIWPRSGSFTGCTESVPHKHGEPAPNGSYSLRVVAHESGSNQEQASSEFTLRYSNPAAAPLWRGTPVASNGVVTLRWYRNAETDVVEYRYTRTDAKGSKVIAIDAAAPTHTPGCRPEQEATFTCADHPAAGTVRYTVKAYRPTPASAPVCKTRSSACVGSAAAPQMTVKVGGGGPAPTPTSGTTTPPPTRGSTPRSTGPATIAPGPTATNTPTLGDSGTTPQASAATDRSNRAPPIWFASIAVAGLVVAHAAFRRRARRQA